MQSKHYSQPTPSANLENNDDDVLGLLGRPVSEFPPPAPQQAPVKPAETSRESESNPQDKCIAELVDMGFPADKARQALETTDDGTDIQAAVGWLLTQAHSESRQKARGQGSTSTPVDDRPAAPRGRRDGSFRSRDSSSPAWMGQEGQQDSSQRRNNNRTPNGTEKDASQLAAEIGSSFFKTANSLWKTGTKKMQQAVQEFNAEGGDQNQPRWMKEAQSRSDSLSARPRHSAGSSAAGPNRQEQQGSVNSGVTDEALLLESGAGRPARKTTRPREEAQASVTRERERSNTPAATVPRREAASPQPAFLRQHAQPNDPRSRLNRQLVEDQSSQAYVSPARRKKTTPKPVTDAEGDLLGGASRTVASQPSRLPTSSKPAPPSRPSNPPAPIAVRPKVPARSIPPVTASALSTSHQHREKGTESFKRGDYAAAHASYSSALSSLPAKHPVTIVLLSNRALASLKIGEPKSAISDADNAIDIIGPSKGESEKVDMGNGETPKDLREFYGKALMRKAEALEQMERWADAAKVWREAIEAGHGGATSIQGRTRCEKAAGINQPAPFAAASRHPTPAVKKPIPVPRKRASALDDLNPQPVVSSAEAVTRLRAANAAADKVDDEKFALADSVDARLTAWKGGKADNLRALLGSLDTVLWAESGWKKVGMAELVLPNKVKIAYMKGIAKVHPDKLPTTATTEQRMIAGAVFSTLNEAWDKFKKENGL